VFFFGLGYASSHTKSTDAPLQPQVVGPNATASPAPPAATVAPSQRRGRGTTGTLAPGIRTSPGAPLTSTHHS